MKKWYPVWTRRRSRAEPFQASATSRGPLSSGPRARSTWLARLAIRNQSFVTNKDKCYERPPPLTIHPPPVPTPPRHPPKHPAAAPSRGYQAANKNPPLFVKTSRPKATAASRYKMFYFYVHVFFFLILLIRKRDVTRLLQPGLKSRKQLLGDSAGYEITTVPIWPIPYHRPIIK